MAGFVPLIVMTAAIIIASLPDWGDINALGPLSAIVGVGIASAFVAIKSANNTLKNKIGPVQSKVDDIGKQVTPNHGSTETLADQFHEMKQVMDGVKESYKELLQNDRDLRDALIYMRADVNLLHRAVNPGTADKESDRDAEADRIRKGSHYPK